MEFGAPVKGGEDGREKSGVRSQDPAVRVRSSEFRGWGSGSRVGNQKADPRIQGSAFPLSAFKRARGGILGARRSKLASVTQTRMGLYSGEAEKGEARELTGESPPTILMKDIAAWEVE
jgi:hypothetical protein